MAPANDFFLVAQTLAEEVGTLRARVAKLEAALQGMLDAASLTSGDCYTDGMPNANWGAIDRAKATARAALGAGKETP